MIDQNFNEILPKFLADVENTLGNQNFLCGEQLSLADFYIGNLYVSWLVNPLAYEPERRAALLQQFPKYTAYGKRFETKMGDFLKRRKPCPA